MTETVCSPLALGFAVRSCFPALVCLCICLFVFLAWSGWMDEAGQLVFGKNHVGIAVVRCLVAMHTSTWLLMVDANTCTAPGEPRRAWVSGSVQVTRDSAADVEVSPGLLRADQLFCTAACHSLLSPLSYLPSCFTVELKFMHVLRWIPFTVMRDASHKY
jgi:hypothetical protein